jgi:hypothetical protein
MPRPALSTEEKAARAAEYLRRPDVIERRRKRDAARVGNPLELEKRRIRSDARYARNWSAQKIKDLRKSAKQRGLEFDIDESDIPLPENCPIFGTPLVRASSNGKQDAPSVDRIDNTKGYVKGNVVVVSMKANAMKRDATLDQLKRMVAFYEQLIEDQNE